MDCCLLTNTSASIMSIELNEARIQIGMTNITAVKSLGKKFQFKLAACSTALGKKVQCLLFSRAKNTAHKTNGGHVFNLFMHREIFSSKP